MNSLAPSTMPQNRSETGVISHDPHSRRYVLHDHSLGQEGGIWLSLKEELVCEVWLSSNGNVSACERALREKCGGKISWKTIRKWLDRNYVQRYLGSRLKDRGILNAYSGPGGKDKWIAEAVMFRDGVVGPNSSTAFMHKLIGQALGFVGDGVVPNQINQIIFTQGNGEA